jgi:glycosyltransferase involved in cell wall biosynthesis
MNKSFVRVWFFLSFYISFIIIKILGLFFRKSQARSKTVLFLENFPFNNSGYQYRAYKWAEFLNKNNFRTEVVTLFDSKTAFEETFHANDLSKFFIKSIWKRLFHCVYARKFSTVIVRRELLFFNDYGNLFMEKFLLSIHSNVILDFDDDIAVAKKQPKEITNLYGKLLLEDGNKFNNALNLYKKFIVASKYLQQLVLNQNNLVKEEDILILPTCVDYEKYPQKSYALADEKIAFGWIGGGHNYFLLDELLPALNKLSANLDFKLIVIGGNKYERDVNFEIEFIPWSLDTEVENLYKIDIGLMPLRFDKRSMGKGGFKLLQYMGLGIVSIASAVTINCEIIDDEENAFLVKEHDLWEEVISKVISNRKSWKEIGSNARNKVIAHYSFEANYTSLEKFLKLTHNQ